MRLCFRVKCFNFYDIDLLSGLGEPQCVIVMTENELVAIDLTSVGWPLHRVPYLLAVNAWSPVTCVQHATSVSDAVWNNILAAGYADVGRCSSKVCLMSNSC